jgi:hypothetical protein
MYAACSLPSMSGHGTCGIDGVLKSNIGTDPSTVNSKVQSIVSDDGEGGIALTKYAELSITSQ